MNSIPLPSFGPSYQALDQFIRLFANKGMDVDEIDLRFHKILKNVVNILQDDAQLAINSHYAYNNFAGRVIEFKRLRVCLLAVASAVSLIASERLKENIFYSPIVEMLDQRIALLTCLLKQQGRMPVNYEDYLATTHKRLLLESTLEHVNEKACAFVEKEVFHMLLNNEPNLEGLNIANLEGNSVARSLIAIASILKKSIKQEVDSSKIYHKHLLLSKIDRATTFAQKLEFIFFYAASPGDAYYEALSQVDPLWLDAWQSGGYCNSLKDNQSPLPFSNANEVSIDQKEGYFLTCSSVKKKIVPKEVLEHDLCWDFLEEIKALKIGDYALFALGTPAHAVIVKISFDQERFKSSPSYTYTLFNTGKGITDHHQIRRGRRKDVKPLTIRYLKKEALGYAFWEQLIQCSLDKTKSMQDFYAIQEEYLIVQGKGKLDTRAGYWYPAQNLGICTYSAAEMCLFNSVDYRETKKIEVIKSSTAISKLKMVVGLRLKQVANFKKNGKNNLKKKIFQKLKQTKRLLKLSQAHLQRFQKEIARWWE